MAVLSDANVQKSISDFISEARQCAKRGNGFAAMSIIFNVILAVSEAVNGGAEGGNKALFDIFVSSLTDRSTWLAASDTIPSDDDISKILNGIRNGMAHALSMPKNVVLTNTLNDAQRGVKTYNDRYFVSTVDFVDFVETTINKLCQENPGAIFDPSGKGRGPAMGQQVWVKD